MIQLPNGCKCSELKVNPSNWETPRASVKKKWFIYYRFYDPKKMEEYPKGKLRVIKRMNASGDLEERQTLVRELMKLGYPFDDYTEPNDYVMKVLGDERPIGSGIALKVMAGDKFNLRVSSWYNMNSTSPDGPSPIENLLDAVINSFAPIVAGKGSTYQQLSNSAGLSQGVADFLTYQENNYNGDFPKSYLNWILFDEQFNFVESGSGADQVPDESIYNNGSVDNAVYVHQFDDLPVTKNGYLYVYVSNETPNIAVYFDNLQLTHIRGPIVEETHYYPFGLTISAISTKAAGELQNKMKFNGQEEQRNEFSDGSGLEWTDYGARMYDNQIGRWVALDPLGEKQYEIGLFNYVGNNPINRIDVNGLYWEDKKSERTGAQIQQAAESRISQLKKDNSQLEKDLEKAKTSEEKEAIGNQINENSTAIMHLERVSNAITEMGNNTEIGFQFGKSSGNIGYTDYRERQVNGETKRTIVMELAGGDGNTAHEIVHGDILRSKYELLKNSNTATFPILNSNTSFNEVSTEMAAYAAQLAIAPQSMPPSIFGTPTQFGHINPFYVGGLMNNSKPVYKETHTMVLEFFKGVNLLFR